MKQGEIYGCRLPRIRSEPAGHRPAVVVQHDRFNASAIATTVVVTVTSNVRLAVMPGNVRLRKASST